MSLHRLYRQTRIFWHNYRQNRPAVIGLTVVLFFGVVALTGPIFSPYSPTKVGVGPWLEPPSSRHLMGTDDLGRDIFSGVLSGIQISFFVGLAAAAASVIIGVIIGGTAGYIPQTDLVLTKITELFQVIPLFLLAVVIVSVFGATLLNLVVVIGILGWPPIARLVRAEILSLRESDFVTAARSCGYSRMNILFDEIFPNVLPKVIVVGTLQVATTILTESTLSFFGFSDPSSMSLGYMLYNANRLLRHAWWAVAFPGVALCAVILGLNLLGEGLNEVLNPQRQER